MGHVSLLCVDRVTQPDRNIYTIVIKSAHTRDGRADIAWLWCFIHIYNTGVWRHQNHTCSTNTSNTHDVSEKLKLTRTKLGVAGSQNENMIGISNIFLLFFFCQWSKIYRFLRFQNMGEKHHAKWNSKTYLQLNESKKRPGRINKYSFCLEILSVLYLCQESLVLGCSR